MRRRAHLLLQAAEQAVGLPRRRPLPRSNEPEELLQRRKDLVCVRVCVRVCVCVCVMGMCTRRCAFA